MNLVPTELNRQLAEAVRHAVAADRFYIAGRSGFWRLVGLGLILFGVGSAVGLVCYGYGAIERNSQNLSSLSTAFSHALSEAKLTGASEGTVEFQPHTIALAKAQTISIAPESILRLDPNAKVVANGDLTVQLPPPVPVPMSVPPPRSGGPLVSNFTVFKHVPFHKGTVMTGWEFLTSKQKSPTTQYCYYTEDSPDSDNSSLPGLSVILNLGRDQRLDLPRNLPKDFDANAAFARCVWFRS